MFYIAIIAWVGGIAVSFYNGNRKLPLLVLLAGIGIWIGASLTGFWPDGIAGIALLAAVIWIANKSDLMWA